MEAYLRQNLEHQGAHRASASPSSIVLDSLREKKLIVMLPSHELVLQSAIAQKKLGVTALSARFLPSGDIVLIDTSLALRKIGSAGLIEILPPKSANAPLFVSTDGRRIAYLKPRDFLGGDTPLTNGIAIIDLDSKKEHLLFEVPNLTIHLYGWRDNSLVVEVPNWSQITRLPSEYMVLGLLATDGASSSINAFASLPMLLPGSDYPQTSFDQQYVSYQADTGVIIVSLKNATYDLVANAQNLNWDENGLVVIHNQAQLLMPFRTFTLSTSAKVTGNVAIPDTKQVTLSSSNSAVKAGVNTKASATATTLLYRPVHSNIPISAYYDLDRAGGSWRTWKGTTGTGFVYGETYDQHEGTDYDGITGDPVFASQVGTVTDVIIDCVNTFQIGTLSYGTNIRIDHGTLSDGNKYQTLYGHLLCTGVSSLIAKNTVISSLPMYIGQMGNSGYSDGDHTHLNVYKAGTLIDPYYAGIISDSPSLPTYLRVTATPYDYASSRPIYKGAAVSHTKRPISVQIFDSNNQLRFDNAGRDMAAFNQDQGSYLAAINLGNNWTSGSYVVKLKIDYTLWRNTPGITTITNGNRNAAAEDLLVAGDIDQNNAVNILDYNILLGCFSELSPAKSCDTAKKRASDITDDGNVNGPDYNLLLRIFSVQPGG
jgi:murein DD-endopeptidase MepM/ murein hydrolase activator NlpD